MLQAVTVFLGLCVIAGAIYLKPTAFEQCMDQFDSLYELTVEQKPGLYEKALRQIEEDSGVKRTFKNHKDELRAAFFKCS